MTQLKVSESELIKVQRLATVSTFALDVITQQPELLAELEQPLQPLQLLEDQESEWPRIIRRWRRAQSCKLIWRDIAGIDSVQQTLQG
ncbi:MAG: hypothetical protein KA350_06290, partial [Arenimonas sp.]|nr:hypothetical protein [Arenimonas sp.]